MEILRLLWVGVRAAVKFESVGMEKNPAICGKAAIATIIGAGCFHLAKNSLVSGQSVPL